MHSRYEDHPVNIPWQDWQQRLFEEKKQVDDRIARLRTFILASPIFHRLTQKEQMLITRQKQAMQAYSDILCERINDFQVPVV